MKKIYIVERAEYCPCGAYTEFVSDKVFARKEDAEKYAEEITKYSNARVVEYQVH